LQIREIQEFSNVRTQIRAYLCFLLSRNIPNRLPSIDFDTVHSGIKKIRREIPEFDALYILDATGTQVVDNISPNAFFRKGKNAHRSHRAYYYRAAREKRCILTDPYPSTLNGILTVTAGYPVYNDKNQLQYVVCVDLSIGKAIAFFKSTTLDVAFTRFSRFVYGTLSVALMLVTFLLFYKGLDSLRQAMFHFDTLEIKEMFEATILITLSLAIFDLVKAIFEEEVLGRHKREDESQVHKTMIRFLGSIIIAISIEALMLVFKFTIIEPDKIIYAVYLIGGVTMLLLGLAVYVRFVSHPEKEITS
jgi:hypothetical protein